MLQSLPEAAEGSAPPSAILAAQNGYSVCVNYASDAEAAEAVVEAIRQDGGSALAVQGDVSLEADILKLFETAERELGPLTALVNNAGVVDQPQRVDAMSYDRLFRMMSINVIGSIMAAREAVKRMSTKYGGKGGAIVNLSSVAARLGSPATYVDYAASKGAIDSFTVGLALEVAKEGIRVNAVRPGIIDTDIHASGGIPDRVEKMRDSLPMAREGSPQEVAEAIQWLLSEKSTYTTGAIIDVSGGR